MKSAEMEPKMKECPFCGGEAFTHILGNEIAKGYYIACDECGAKTKVFGYEAEAIEAWNHRFAPDTNDGSKELGEWVHKEYGQCHCSECGYTVSEYEISPYCPQCGAMMDWSE